MEPSPLLAVGIPMIIFSLIAHISQIIDEWKMGLLASFIGFVSGILIIVSSIT